MERVRKCATEFRKAIDSALGAGEFYWDSPFRRFPQGCCGDTSNLLAQYLLEQGIESVYVCGTCYETPDEEPQSHAWLVVARRIIVDITGDQFYNKAAFLNYNKPVFVGELDRFHELFDVTERNIDRRCGLDELGDSCKSRLWRLYRCIVKYMK